jgi:hypothetical protein
MNDMFNRRNTRYWAQQNLRLMRKDQFKEKFTANVWAGIVRSRTIEPIFFQRLSNKQQYLGFLQNKIEGFLVQLSVAVLRRLCFQQDVAAPHHARQVVNSNLLSQQQDVPPPHNVRQVVNSKLLSRQVW